MSALAIEQLTVRYAEGPPAVVALDLTIEERECVALVGASGSGKSTVAAAILGVLPPSARVAGRVQIGGHDMASGSESGRRALRGRGVALVPQDTGAALNPVVPVVDQVAEVFRVHDGDRRRAARAKAAGLLEELSVDAAVSARRLLPDELSGGMRQRALVAIALALEPRVVVADEPTSSLDPESTLDVLECFERLRTRSSTALLFVTHDLGVAGIVGDRTAVLRRGSIVEIGPTDLVLGSPAHPHTRALVAAVPRLGPRSDLDGGIDR